MPIYVLGLPNVPIYVPTDVPIYVPTDDVPIDDMPTDVPTDDVPTNDMPTYMPIYVPTVGKPGQRNRIMQRQMYGESR